MNTKTQVIEALEQFKREDISSCEQVNTFCNMLGRRLNGRDHEDGDVFKPDHRLLNQAIALLRSLPSEQGEGPYRKVECGSNRPGSVKFYRIKGPDDEMDYALHENDVDYHLKRLNAAYQAGRLSAQLAHPPQVGPVVTPSASEDAAAIAIANAKLPWCLWDPNGGGVSVVGPFPDGTYGDPGKPYGSYTKRVQFRVVNGEIHVQP